MDTVIFKHLVETRRLIHQSPELGYWEYNTAAIVCQELDKFQISYKKGNDKRQVWLQP